MPELKIKLGKFKAVHGTCRGEVASYWLVTENGSDIATCYAQGSELNAKVIAHCLNLYAEKVRKSLAKAKGK